jgi:hypothetical protein
MNLYPPHNLPPKNYVDAYQAGYNDGLLDLLPRKVANEDANEYMAGYWRGQSMYVSLRTSKSIND